MSFDYARSAATAARLLAQFGQPVTHGRVIEGAYDPATGTVANMTVEQTGSGVLLEYSTREAGEMRAAGVLVTTNTRKLLLSLLGINDIYDPADVNDILILSDWYDYFFTPIIPQTAAPAPNDTVTVSGVVYTVDQAKTLKPAATVVMHELMVTR